MAMRVAVYGGTDLTSDLSDFVQELTKRLLAFPEAASSLKCNTSSPKVCT